MKKIEYIIGLITLFVGILTVFIGMLLSGEYNVNSMSVVVGGGIFISFATFILYINRE